MFDCLKEKVQSKLIFHFMKKCKKPKQIEILNFKKSVGNDDTKLEFDFCDFSINQYKVYDCKTTFDDKIEFLYHRFCIKIFLYRFHIYLWSHVSLVVASALSESKGYQSALLRSY